jgi:peptidoglycan/LPS O-acetylase OafA/YrhL
MTNEWRDVTSLIVWIAIFAIPERGLALLLPILILLAFLATFNGSTARPIFRIRWIALTGGMCYSFYLMHMLVISVVFKFTRRLVVSSNFALSCLVQIVVLGTCIYLCCTVFYVLIERPCMDPSWPRKVLAKLLKPKETLEVVSK